MEHKPNGRKPVLMFVSPMLVTGPAAASGIRKA